MPSSVFLSTNFQLLSKRTRRRRDDLSVAGKPPQFLAFLYQRFVGERLDKFAVILGIKFLQSDWTMQGNTRVWSVEVGTEILTRRLRYHFVTMPKKKAQREHHYIRVIITYSDGETSANRVFKDKAKAEEYAARQKKSLTVKSATLKPFVRDTYAATRVRQGRGKQRA